MSITRPRTSLDDLRALVADLGALLRALPRQPDPDLEQAIGQAIGRCGVADDPDRPRVLALITDDPQTAAYTARCTGCPWRRHRTDLILAASYARAHAVSTGHVVTLDAPAVCACGRPIEPALEYGIDDPAPRRATCRACAEAA
jgi:hypothetical protein